MSQIRIVSSKTDCSPWAVFLIFLRLGLTSFGGPIAHLGYFRDEVVVRRQWLSEQSYADLAALCQFLPGPASSQVGIALGLSRCGYAGALAAWAGFTLPSAIALMLFAGGISNSENAVPSGALYGLKLVAVAVVAQAVWGMARNLCFDAPRVTIMAAATLSTLLVPSAWGQVGAIVIAAIVGLVIFRPQQMLAHEPLPIAIRRSTGLLWLVLFFALLIALPLLTAAFPNQALAMVDSFFRVGSLVFGGGHVALPLLQAEVVPSGWVSNDTFLAGYGAAQAVPGPLFTFAAFLGASMNQTPTGWVGGLIGLLAIFAPSFLLVFGTVPFWEHLRRNTQAQAALSGVNAAVVGLLLSVLYQPIWTNTIHTSFEFGMALVALIALMFWKLPVWLVVVTSGVIGWWATIAL